jgi:hypothetical protein
MTSSNSSKQLINNVTDLRHPLIFNRINPRTVIEVKGDDGIELLGGRHPQLEIGAMIATSSAVGTCSPRDFSA